MSTHPESDVTETEFTVDFTAVIDEHPIRFYLFCVTALALCFLCHLILTASSEHDLHEEAYRYIDYHSDLPNELIETFIDLDSSHELDLILTNLSDFPIELIELSIKNHETIPFVSNYLHYISGETAPASVTQSTLAEDIPLFLQWDPAWGYSLYGDTFMALTGCAPTVVAMAVAALTDDDSIDPRLVADYAEASNFYVDGVGTSWDLIHTGLHNFGLDSEELPLTASAILQTLAAGDLIIVSVAPGTFTQTGHFLLLTGVTENNMITIHDPNSEENSSILWPVDVFLNETKNLWRVSAIN